MKMFKKGEIWAYPTNTSFGLGVRSDDETGLQNLADLKSREKNMFFSLMVADLAMLKNFAEIPPELEKNLDTFFTQKPRTAILKPTAKLPKSVFWPAEKVAFRVSTIPQISREIKFPVTATSANISGEPAIYNVQEIREIFGDQVKVFTEIPVLPEVKASEIWDFTVSPAVRIR